MKNTFSKVRQYVLAHKVLSAIILIVIISVGYGLYKKATSTSGDTRYVTAKVQRGTIVATVSGTGQVSDSNQIDLKSKASGDVVYVGAHNGDKVSVGTLIVELDTQDAEKVVRDAETSLASTKLALEKLKIQNSNDNLTADQKKAYDDGFSVVSKTFLDLTPTLSGVDGILSQGILSENSARVVSNTALSYRIASENSYYSAQEAFDVNKKDYAALGIGSSASDVEKIINETYKTTNLLSGAIKDSVNFVDFMAKNSNKPENFTTAQNTLSSYSNTINGHLTDLLAAETTINNNKDSTQNASIDVQSAELSVQQKENALQDAKDKLSDYFIRAPLDGIVANLSLNKLDSVTSGTLVASVVTAKQLALISLNEVDVAKIKIGEKATLTFDAIPDLSISGIVTEIDPIGVVSQGVVTYDVKVSFDSQDDRVRPSMSVSAAIITDIKQDVLAVANSAVKSQAGTSYVEMFDILPPPPTDGLLGSISKIAPNKIPVEIGLINDSQTEIISGIKEGDAVVTRTILPTTAKTTTTAPSIFGSPAGGNRGGGAPRGN